MTATPIDGKTFAATMRLSLGARIATFKEKTGITPALAVIIVGDDAASHVYVKNKGMATREVGMTSLEYKLPADTSEEVLLKKVQALNENESVHGILVQLPLPKGVSEQRVIAAIDPRKDVDGFHILNAGLLATGQEGLVPCTPVGCLHLIKSVCADLKGKHAVVVGRSNIVGKPVAALLLGQDCTVTMAHSRTLGLEAVCKMADILVVAVGRPEMVKGSWIKQGAIVIDVGINRTSDGKLVGDVDYGSVSQVASYITPVPGGVGPMTIACLLENTLKAACGLVETPPL
jgi:methylenetetrahydrofolate dehydrogenase (NADP+)/methenyltetrahydrofolate cyclohydrolase